MVYNDGDEKEEGKEKDNCDDDVLMMIVNIMMIMLLMVLLMLLLMMIVRMGLIVSCGLLLCTYDLFLSYRQPLPVASGAVRNLTLEPVAQQTRPPSAYHHRPS